MDDAELVARLSRRGNRYDDGAMMHGELINPDGPAAIACIEAIEAENERLREALENIGNLSLNGCIKVNTPHGLWVGTPDAYAREVLGMPWRTEDPDYSNEMLRG